MVIGVPPVRARCGYRLCLTQRQATNPNNDASHLDLAAAASTPRSSQAANGQHQQQQQSPDFLRRFDRGSQFFPRFGGVSCSSFFLTKAYSVFIRGL